MKKTHGGVIVGNKGLAGVSVTVYLHGTETLADLYSDEGITPIANPMTTDSAGRFEFYCANGNYDIKFTGPTIVTHTYDDILIQDLAATTEINKLADDPATGGWGEAEGGTVWYNTTEKKFKGWNGTEIILLG